jgi:hypothetical protein
MEEKSVKTVAFALVVIVAAYAVYKLFEGSSILGGLGSPGLTTSNLTSIPGVSQFPVTAPTSATPQALASVASSTLAEYSPAFGSSANPSSSDETDYDDLDMSSGDEDED